MKYEQLSDEYQADTLADALYAREVEFFHYDFDRGNFEKMIESMPPSPFRESIQARLSETLVQMGNVEAIYAALRSRITDPQAHAAAAARCAKKRREKV